MRILAHPRSWNPYQRFLYDEIERAGHRVRYVGELTPSHTLNVLLLPAELIVWRLVGWRVLHIHWVYAFAFTGSGRFPILRRVAQAWFSLVLGLCRLTGIRVVWTAHNVLPHGRVFHDDLAARRRLAAATDLVVAHNQATVECLRQSGIFPRRSAVIGSGPLNPGFDPSSLPKPGSAVPPLKLLFLGQVLEYKGVEDLIDAVAQISPAVSLTLTVAGECPDVGLRDRLTTRAAEHPDRITLRLERIPGPDLADVFGRADLVVLPFRRVTSSGSALLAMGHGRGLVLPEVNAFADLPSAAVAFYDGSIASLRGLLSDAAQWSPDRLRTMGDAASAHVSTLSWADTARQTLAAIGTEIR